MSPCFGRTVCAVGLAIVVGSPGLAGGPAGAGERDRRTARIGAPPAPPLVLAAEVDAIIHPVAAEYITQVIERADRDGAALVVFTLRTPGGLVDSTRVINTRILSARTPVAVFVGPSGARAASAGFLIVLAADVAAMAPGTHIGAAHPVSGSGEKLDETVAKKTASDVAADARSLAARRKRNAALAEQAVLESRAFTDEEALRASPPLIDLVVADVDGLLRALDGREITRFDGTHVVLQTSGARVERVAMSTRQRILSAIAHPQIAYLLFSLGTLGLTIELWNPGAVVPGVVGGLCLLLAFFAFQVLPVNYVGLLLILFGMLLLVLEVKVTSFGLLTAGGLASLVFGSMILMDSPVPELRVSLRVIVPVALSMGLIAAFLARLGIQAQRKRATTGTAGMVDETGRALTPVGPGLPGRVATHGEIWQATADEAIAVGDRVRVVSVEGLTLLVRRDAGPAREGRSS
jgi:membrane-bound serine protease (ClpP class)